MANRAVVGDENVGVQRGREDGGTAVKNQTSSAVYKRLLKRLQSGASLVPNAVCNTLIFGPNFYTRSYATISYEKNRYEYGVRNPGS